MSSEVRDIPPVPQEPQRQEMSYEDRMRRIMARLRSGDFFSLTDGESADITILSDIDAWVEVPTHQWKGQGTKGGRYVCPRALHQECPECDAGKTARLGLGLSLFNRTSGMVQVVFWSMHKSSPLNDIEETYKSEKVPVRGMKFKIRRRGAKRDDTVYLMTYQGHDDSDTLGPHVPHEQVLEVISTVLAKKEEKDNEA